MSHTRDPEGVQKLQTALGRKIRIEFPVYVGISPSYSPPPIGYMIADSEVKAFQSLVGLLREVADELERTNVDPHRPMAIDPDTLLDHPDAT